MVLPDATKQMVLDTLIEVFGQEKVDAFPPPLMAMMQAFYLAAFRDGGNYRAKQLQAEMGNQGGYDNCNGQIFKTGESFGWRVIAKDGRVMAISQERFSTELGAKLAAAKATGMNFG